MIHPTRTNLLMLKDKALSVSNSIGILKARRQALIREFLNTTRPFIRSREEIRRSYGKALEELALSMGHEGKDSIESITVATKRDIGTDITERSIWGLKYKDISIHEPIQRSPEERKYDYRSTTHHLEECISLFEKIVETMIEIASYESKLKRLGDEILKTTRRIRMLEERVQPELKYQVKFIAQYIGEREREAYNNLRLAKEMILS